MTDTPFDSTESSQSAPEHHSSRLATDSSVSSDFSQSSDHGISYKIKKNLKAILGGALLVLLASGIVSGYYLMNSSAEIRQQASGGYSCAGGVGAGVLACSGFREVVKCGPTGFEHYASCSDSQRCEGDKGCQGLPAQTCAGGVTEGNIACDTGTTFVTCRSGSFVQSTSCGENKICRNGACLNMDGSPIASTPPATDGQQIGSCFTGADCKEGAKSTLSACQANKGYTNRNECLAKNGQAAAAAAAAAALQAANALANSKFYVYSSSEKNCVPNSSGATNVQTYKTETECKSAHPTRFCFVVNSATRDCDSIRVDGTTCTGSNYGSYSSCHLKALEAPNPNNVATRNCYHPNDAFTDCEQGPEFGNTCRAPSYDKYADCKARVDKQNDAAKAAGQKVADMLTQSKAPVAPVAQSKTNITGYKLQGLTPLETCAICTDTIASGNCNMSKKQCEDKVKANNAAYVAAVNPGQPDSGAVLPVTAVDPKTQIECFRIDTTSKSCHSAFGHECDEGAYATAATCGIYSNVLKNIDSSVNAVIQNQASLLLGATAGSY